MKKIMIALVALTFVACGGSNESEVVSDSVAVAVDTAAITATDSTVAQIPVGGGSSSDSKPVK